MEDNQKKKIIKLKIKNKVHRKRSKLKKRAKKSNNNRKKVKKMKNKIVKFLKYKIFRSI